MDYSLIVGYKIDPEKLDLSTCISFFMPIRRLVLLCTIRLSKFAIFYAVIERVNYNPMGYINNRWRIYVYYMNPRIIAKEIFYLSAY